MWHRYFTIFNYYHTSEDYILRVKRTQTSHLFNFFHDKIEEIQCESQILNPFIVSQVQIILNIRVPTVYGIPIVTLLKFSLFVQFWKEWDEHKGNAASFFFEHFSTILGQLDWWRPQMNTRHFCFWQLITIELGSIQIAICVDKLTPHENLTIFSFFAQNFDTRQNMSDLSPGVGEISPRWWNSFEILQRSAKVLFRALNKAFWSLKFPTLSPHMSLNYITE